jgi:hypothetical protein
MSKNKFDWKATLATVAPGLATALGGPLAGLAVQQISNSLLGHPNGTEDELSQAMASGGADALLKMKQAQVDFDVKMEELGVQRYGIEVQDRSNARDMAKSNMLPQIILSLVFVGGYFTTLSALHGVLFQESEMNGQIVALFGALIGVFTREISGIMQFWFGSSSGSKEKTVHLANSTPAQM